MYSLFQYRPKKLCALVILALSCLPVLSNGQEEAVTFHRWVEAAVGNWADAAHWEDKAVPLYAPKDSAVIGNRGKATLQASVTIGGLAIGDMREFGDVTVLKGGSINITGQSGFATQIARHGKGPNYGNGALRLNGGALIGTAKSGMGGVLALGAGPRKGRLYLSGTPGTKLDWQGKLVISGNGFLYFIDDYLGSAEASARAEVLSLLPGAELVVSPTALPKKARFSGPVILIEYGTLEGTFEGLVEGATLKVGEQAFTVTYGSGENSAIALMPKS